MSFDNSQMTLIHLVSFPSLWLPPANTLKVMIIGVDQAALEELVSNCQNSFPDYSFAFYHAPELDLQQSDVVDWLIINQNHMHGTFVEVKDWETLSLALSSKGLTRVNTEKSSAEISKIAEYAGKTCCGILAFISEITTNSRKV